MKRKLEIEINCGDLTCASKKEGSCDFIGQRGYSEIFACLLFPSNDVSYTFLEVKNDKILRCKECLKSEIRKEE